jgi:hypothetical protein
MRVLESDKRRINELQAELREKDKTITELKIATKVMRKSRLPPIPKKIWRN